MKLLRQFACLCCLLAVVAVAHAGSLKSQVIQGALTTCAKPGVTTVTTWLNTLGFPIYVPAGYLWLGEDMTGASDTGLWLIDTTSGVVFTNTNWDHYAEPTSIQANQLVFNVSPNYFTVAPNDAVTLFQACTGPYTNSGAIHINTQVTLYYLTTPPN